MIRALIIGALVALIGLPIYAQTAEEYIQRLEANQTHDTSIFRGVFIITDRFGERRSAFINHNRGVDDSLVEFTSAAERGQRILRTADEIYLYYPDAEEIIRLQGAALRESLLGSDVSYEDMTGNRGFLDDYTAEVAGTETIDGRETVIIELRAKRSQIAYPRQRIWIDTERYISVRSEQYAQSGRLLKVSETREFAEINGKMFPVHFVITDQLKRGSMTEVVLEDIEIDVSLPRSLFSLSELAF